MTSRSLSVADSWASSGADGSPVAVVDVDRILKQDRQVDQRQFVLSVKHLLEEDEVALHLAISCAPPVGEVRPVRRQDGVEVSADFSLYPGVSGTRAP